MEWRVVDTDEQWETHISISEFKQALKLCKDRGATTFHLIGPQTYAEALVKVFDRIQMSEYEEHKIKVEVN